MNDILKDIKETLNNDTLVVAVSGGPDSMCLLHLLLKTNSKIIVAHVNHNLRKESKDEMQMVENFCTKNNTIFEYKEIKHYEKNIENYAREERYKFFEKLIEKYRAKYLLTAHHGDDLIETVLMRMIKGTNIKELIGFKKLTKRNNYTIYRPLIDITKEDILLYCGNNNIPYCIDSTNKKDTYTRNRIRKYILPYLKKENKNIHINFIKYSNSLDEIDNYIEKKSKEKKIISDQVIDIELLKKEENIIKRQIIYDLLKDTYKDRIKIIKEKHIENIINMLKCEKPNLKQNLPLNYEFIKSYGKATIVKIKEQDKYNYILKSEIKLNENHIIKLVEKEEDNSNYTLRLNKNNIKMPLHIRNRKDGDIMEVKGLNGKKKIKDIFIDEKVPKENRKTIPIVTDDEDTILWIPGIKKSKFDVSNKENCDIIIRYF